MDSARRDLSGQSPWCLAPSPPVRHGARVTTQRGLSWSTLSWIWCARKLRAVIVFRDSNLHTHSVEALALEWARCSSARSVRSTQTASSPLSALAHPPKYQTLL